MVSKYCRCGFDNSLGKQTCPNCSRDLTIAVMPDLCHIQNWQKIERQRDKLVTLICDHNPNTRKFDAVLDLLDGIIADANLALASAERGVVPCTEGRSADERGA